MPPIDIKGALSARRSKAQGVKLKPTPTTYTKSVAKEPLAVEVEVEVVEVRHISTALQSVSFLTCFLALGGVGWSGRLPDICTHTCTQIGDAIVPCTHSLSLHTILAPRSSVSR